MRSIVAGLLCICLVSCKQSKQVYVKAYFDFDSLVATQQARLLSVRATVIKKTTLNNQAEEATFIPDSLTWTKEFEVFRQLDVINKPGFKDTYKITDNEKDSRSNLLIRRYESTLANAPVPRVTFYYQDEFSRLHKLEASFREENTLFKTERKLMLEFDDAAGSHLLSQYRLTGVQKMVLGDSLRYSVEATVVPGVF
ncbi:MAG: hypothetical protein KF775_06620 [Cyclobacteriaceae bacterium]|nr:hypothetical protein [Cytophagales bacterium]MBX2899303.1 hypothetical protein [Cyclobacteriaceae bacterium]